MTFTKLAKGGLMNIEKLRNKTEINLRVVADEQYPKKWTTYDGACIIGTIRWSELMGYYIFSPIGGNNWSEDCLRRVVDFMENLDQEKKN